MKKRTIWLIAGSLITSALLMVSCTPAPPGEEETVTPAEEVAPAEEEDVVAEEEEVVAEEEEEAAPTEEEVVTEEEEEAPPAPSEKTLFSDPFGDENSGWDTYSNESGWVKYQDGWLHMKASTSGDIEIDSYANQHFADFVLEVETKFVDGTDDNWHSVCCRVNAQNSYYEFSISADGYYRLAIWMMDEDIDPSNQATFSSHIRQGRDAINLLRIECVGNNLRLLVNGQLLTEMTDNRLTGGDITLGVASLADAFSEIAFDNLVVTEP